MITKNNFSTLLKYFPALTSGLLLTFSFPGSALSYLAFFALIPLLISIQSMTLKESFYAGFITGVTFFLTLIYWIVSTVHVYGKLNPILSVGVLTLLCLYLALYPAIFTYLLKKFIFPLQKNYKILISDNQQKLYYIPVLTACLWIGLEYIRTYAFTGFSWGVLGYSQFKNLYLIQIADFTGVYGVSFLIVLVNSSLALLLMNYKTSLKRDSILLIIFTSLIVMGVYLYGHHRINNIDSMVKTAQKTNITIIQGNIKQALKWSDDFKLETVKKYVRLSKSQIQRQPDLVIWPETALPFYYGLDQKLSTLVDECIKTSKTNFLIGSPAFEATLKPDLKPGKQKIKFYNRVYMLDQFSNIQGQWDKHHLVPFGEYVPFGDYLSFLGKITAQAGNFSAGEQPFSPLEFNSFNQKVTRDKTDTDNKQAINRQTMNKLTSIKTGVLICFEILFPQICANFVRNGADILTTITNDAWFGYSSAAMQHFSIAVFRAVENHRTMIRAANTGISGFIDPKGKIIESTSLFTDKALTRQVPVITQISFYTKYGDIFVMVSILAICMVFMLKELKNNKRKRGKSR